MSDQQIAESTETKFEKLFCAIIFIIAIILAFWFRFYQIGIKPFHHDEGVNSYFLLNLASTGEYRYDPVNYHGPTLYYLALIALRIFGENDLALRFWPALFGVLTVAMLWLLRHHLGTVGTPVAAVCMALSPGLVYYSRDFIHEMSFGCFTMGIVVGAWRFAETKKFIWLVLLSASAALLFTTKETAIINATVLIIAILCAAIWDITRNLMRQNRFSFAETVEELKSDLKAVLPSLDHLLAALIIFVSIYIFFYSSLFTHWQGVTDFFKSIWLWASERSNKDHVHPFYYYIGIILKLELPLLIGSLLGGLFVFGRGNRFWLFIAAWTLGTALAYSLIPYKTPWLIVSFLIPMAIITGYAAQQLYRLSSLISWKIIWAAAIIALTIFCWHISWIVNLENYDDNDNRTGYLRESGEGMKLKPYVDGQYGYVYAQTDRDTLELVEAIKNETDKLGTGIRTGIYVASPDYWPLPWYLREYKHVTYSGGLDVLPGQKLSIAQPFVIASVTQQNIFNGHPGWRSVARAFTLRPGVELVLYVREEEENTKSTQPERRDQR